MTSHFLSAVYPKRSENIQTKMFIVALSTIAKRRNNPNNPQTDDWTNKWYIYIIEYSAIKRSGVLIHSMA